MNTEYLKVGHCKVYVDSNAKVVVAVSTFAGKSVRGVARCHPADTFDVEYGTALAVSRCNYAVAVKRMKRADQRVHDALVRKYDADAFYSNMKDYERRARNDVFRLKNELEELESLYV